MGKTGGLALDDPNTRSSASAGGELLYPPVIKTYAGSAPVRSKDFREIRPCFESRS